VKIVETMHDAQVGGIVLKAGKYYVGSDNAAAGMVNAAPRLLRVVADAAPYIQHWRGQPLHNNALLIYRCLGMGDEFMAARLAAYAAHFWPSSKVQLSIFDAHHELWSGSTLPFRLSGALIPFDEWQSFDYHVAGERWWETDAMPNQPSAWQMMQDACGIWMLPEHQIPFLPTPSATTAKDVADFLEDWIQQSNPIVLWQLAATSRIRSYPPENTRAALQELLSETTANIILAGHPSQIAAYSFPETPRIRVYSAGIEGLIAMCHLLALASGAAAPSPRSGADAPSPRACIVPPSGAAVPSLRSCIVPPSGADAPSPRSCIVPPSGADAPSPRSCIVPPSGAAAPSPRSCIVPPSGAAAPSPRSCIVPPSGADAPSPRSCIVCPDSVLGHIAAAFPALPVVSLWSSFRPADRVEPYRNHRPIYHPIQCSPCRAHEQTGDPRHYRGCPLTGCNDYCAGLRNISHYRIVSAVKEVIP
jgi:hypothetical protein